MTITDAAQLAIALLALWVAVAAIRRDRPELLARFMGAAMGTVAVSVVNVGLRPVRVERVIRREGWVRRRDRDWTLSPEAAAVTIFTELPTVMQPGDEIKVAIANVGFVPGHGGWQLVDAAGHRYGIRRRR